MDWRINGESDYSDYSYLVRQAVPLVVPAIFLQQQQQSDRADAIHPGTGSLHQRQPRNPARIARDGSPALHRRSVLRAAAALDFAELHDHRPRRHAISVTGWPQTLWLTDQERVDQDMAAFGEVSYDIIPSVTLTGGMRLYDYVNTLKGFFGFSAGFSSHTGESQCFGPGQFHQAPCTDLDQSAVGTGNTHKINLTWRVDDKRLVYFTWSTGFRPGGINRRTDDAGPYAPDKLTNYEVGWKIDLARRHAARERRPVPRRLEQCAIPVPGRELVHDHPERGQRDVARHRERFRMAADPRAHLLGLRRRHRRQSDEPAIAASTIPPPSSPIRRTVLPMTAPPPEAPAGTQLPITPKWKGNLTTALRFPARPVRGAYPGVGSGAVERVGRSAHPGRLPALCAVRARAHPQRDRQAAGFRLVRSQYGNRHRCVVAGIVRPERLRRRRAAISLRRMRDAGLPTADLCRAGTPRLIGIKFGRSSKSKLHPPLLYPPPTWGRRRVAPRGMSILAQAVSASARSAFSSCGARRLLTPPSARRPSSTLGEKKRVAHSVNIRRVEFRLDIAAREDCDGFFRRRVRASVHRQARPRRSAPRPAALPTRSASSPPGSHPPSP